MIPVSDYKTFWESVSGMISDINHLFIVDDEMELTKKINQVSDRDILLVAVYPSADFQPMDEDNYGDVDTCVVYILMKIDERNCIEDDIMEERIKTQALMSQLRLLMLSLAGNHEDQSVSSRIMKQLIHSKQHIDRERNYLGCNGYSISFGLKTNGL